MAMTFGTGNPTHPSTYGGSETVAHSTATNFVALSPHVEVSFIGMSTDAAGLTNSLFELTATGNGDAIEGMEKIIMATATGMANVFIEMPSGRMTFEGSTMVNTAATDIDVVWASATGNFRLAANNDYIRCRFINGSWLVEGGVGATMLAAT